MCFYQRMSQTPTYFFQDRWLTLLDEVRCFGDRLGASEDVWDSVAGDRMEETHVRLLCLCPSAALHTISAVYKWAALMDSLAAET